MGELVRILRAEHVGMATLLDVMDRQIDLFRQGNAPNFNIIRGIVSYFLAYPDLYHHPKEDLITQKLRTRLPQKAAAIEAMFSEHQDLALLTRRFASALIDQLVRPNEVPNKWFSALARDFVDTNRRHMASEEERFLPTVLRALTEEDGAELEAKMMSGADPLFGGRIEKHFSLLHSTILDLERNAASGRPA